MKQVQFRYDLIGTRRHSLRMPKQMPPPPIQVDFVIDSILMQLRAGALRSGQRLPSIRDEARLFGVGKNTDRRSVPQAGGSGGSCRRNQGWLHVVRVPASSVHGPPFALTTATDRVSLLAEQLDRRLPSPPG